MITPAELQEESPVNKRVVCPVRYAVLQLSALSSEQNEHDKHDTTNKSNQIAGTMRPEVNQERHVTIRRNTISDRTHEKHPAIRCGEPTHEPSERGSCK